MKEVKVTEEKLEEYKDLARDNPTGFKVIVNEFKKDKYYEFICTTRRSWTYFRYRSRW